MVLLLAIVVIGAGLIAAWRYSSTDMAPSEGVPQEMVGITEDSATPVFRGAPAIAVLPFTNLSDDPEQEYFADGIAEDLITRLSGWRVFPVIARNSSFTYKGRAVDVKQVGRELGVRYVVEGSVRKAGGHLRMTAQLIDAISGAHIWARNYDRKLEDVFAIQDEISTAIAAAMGISLLTEEQAISRRRSRDLSAYDLWMRGNWTHNLGRREGNMSLRNAEARALFEEAIELDPGYAIAYASLADTFRWDSFIPAKDRLGSLEKAEKAARKALLLDPQLAYAHLTLAQIHQVRREKGEMLVAARRAVELDPSLSDAYKQLGFCLAEAGEPEEAIEVLDRGIRLSPSDPWLSESLRAKSRAYFAAGKYGDAIDWAKRSIRQKPISGDLNWLDLAAAQAHMGLLEEAGASLAKAEQYATERGTTFALSQYQRSLFYIDEDFNRRWFDALRSAGFK